VYDRLKGGQFHLKAFISVGQNRDKKDLIGDIIKEFIGDNFNAKNSNEEQLIAKLQRLLENKRYALTTYPSSPAIFYYFVNTHS